MFKTAFGDNAIGRTQIFEWIWTLKHEETKVEDCGSPGCPSVGRTDDGAEKVCEDVGGDERNTVSGITCCKVQGYYKRNRYFQWCIETKLLKI
jgi:hypothetical protein